MVNISQQLKEHNGYDLILCLFVRSIHPKIGFDLLLNESRTLEKDGQKIQLVGVENWGKKFKKAGDLNKASIHVLAKLE